MADEKADKIPSMMPEKLPVLLEYRFNLLTQEMKLIQQRIGDFDGMLFRIKGWATTLFSTFVLFALGENGSVFHIAIGAATVLLFWFLDAWYRKIQLGHVDRYGVIESFLRSNDFDDWINGGEVGDVILPDIVNQKNSSSKKRTVTKAVFDPGTAPAYTILLLLSLGILIWMLVNGG